MLVEDGCCCLAHDAEVWPDIAGLGFVLSDHFRADRGMFAPDIVVSTSKGWKVPLVAVLTVVMVLPEEVIARVPMKLPSNPLSDLTGPEKVVRDIAMFLNCTCCL